jgi:hypothetical protein
MVNIDHKIAIFAVISSILLVLGTMMVLPVVYTTTGVSFDKQTWTDAAVQTVEIAQTLCDTQNLRNQVNPPLTGAVVNAYFKPDEGNLLLCFYNG